jgi:hypothetical protein
MMTRTSVADAPPDIASAAQVFVDACHTLDRNLQVCLRDERGAFTGPCSDADVEGALFRAGGYSPPNAELTTPEMCKLSQERPGELLLEFARRYPFASPIGWMHLASECAAENRDVCDRASYEIAMMPSMAVADGVVTEADVRWSMKKQADECRKLPPSAQVCERPSYRALHKKECAELQSVAPP